MPELPEVESARVVIERSALNRRIADVDDSDTYECRPHRPGEIRDALRRTPTHRGPPARQADVVRDLGRGPSRTPGPHLGIHLGMAGRILVDAGDGDDVVDEGGDYAPVGPQPARKPEWDRFTITFDDGGTLRLFDKRRLGRVRLDPDLDALGPDAGEIGARRVPRARRAGHRAGEGPAARPVGARRRGQPARRRGALAGRASSPTARSGDAHRRRSSTSCAANCAPRSGTPSATAACTPAR